MSRFWTIPFFAFVALVATMTHAGEKAKEIVVKGALTKDDPKDAQRGGAMKSHTYELKAGVVYTIDMVSTDFDSYLRLLDPKGNQLDEDDDSGGNLNSRIVFNCTKDGEYKIVTTTFGAGASGNYTLQIKNTGVAQKAATAHTQMIGKGAPDFSSDFAINGKPGKLADLKGKVVLLYFWDVRSTSCVNMLPILADWHKAHKDDGLVIVGATFYTYEIGQKLGWDKENGKVSTIKKADQKSDQALLAAYAEHYKIEHTLWAMPKETAFVAANAYVVNGYPQVVLIDRKGDVRFIDVNGEKGKAGVESELKKILAEK